MSNARTRLGDAADLDSAALLPLQLSNRSCCSVSRACGPYHGQFIHKGLTAILQPEIRYICLHRICSVILVRMNRRNTNLVDIVPSRTRQVPVLPKPMSLDLHLEPALQNRVPCKFGEGALREFIDLPRVRKQDPLTRNGGDLRVRRRYTLREEVPRRDL